jgi:hypothetical protein
MKPLAAVERSQLSGSIGEPAFPSRPGAAQAAARNEGDGRSGATRSHAQRALPREHGEDREHRTFPEVSTVAHSAMVGKANHVDDVQSTEKARQPNDLRAPPIGKC